MKTLKDFISETIDFTECTHLNGFGSSCEVTEYGLTYTTCGDGEDEGVTSYDDDGNETGWEIRDEFC